MRIHLTALNQSVAPDSRIWRWGLAAIVTILVVTALVQSVLLPVFEGSDEPRHYAYARYLLHNLQLPPRIHADYYKGDFSEYKVGQEAGQPPFYYGLVALAVAAVPNADNGNDYVHSNPYSMSYDITPLPYDNHNFYLHGRENQFPFEGLAMAVHLGRLVSVVLGAFTLLGVYGIARALAPDRPAVALLATGLFAGVPGVIFRFSTITNDAAITCFVTLTMWMAVRIAREGPTARLALLGSLFGSCAVLSKFNGVWAVGILWLTILLAAYQRRREYPLKSSLAALSLSVGLCVILTGWWFAYGAFTDSDPLGVSIHLTQPGQQFLGNFSGSPLAFFQPSSLTTWDWSTWYSVVWSRISGPPWLYTVFRVIFYTGAAGALGLFVTSVATRPLKNRQTGMDNPTFLQYLAVGLAVVFSLALADLWEMTDRQLLGRYLYPGLTSAMALVALGWAWWLERLRRLHAPHTLNWAFALVVIIAWQGTSIWATYNTLASLLPHQLITPVTPDVTQTQLTYLDPLDEHTPVARLIGYRLPSQDLRPGSAMIADLCWKSTGFTRRSFSYSMQLVGPADIQLGARNSYHGLGSYPITAWRNGESFCDPTSLSVDFAADRPRAYPLVVTLFPIDAPDYRAGPALVSLDASGQEVYPQITRVRVAPLHMPVVTPTISLGGVAGLAGTQLQWLPTHTLSVTLTWLALGATSHNNKVFMHVADSATGAVVAQSDHEPDDGWFPTAYWRKDDVITDQFEIPLPAGADAKGLSLSLGMYDAQTHERLAAVDMATGRRYRDDVVPFAP